MKIFLICAVVWICSFISFISGLTGLVFLLLGYQENNLRFRKAKLLTKAAICLAVAVITAWIVIWL